MFLGVLAGGLAAASTGRAASDPDPWPELAALIFPARTLEDGTALLAIEAPYRAEDAAVVPVTLRTTIPADDTRQVRRITLVIDGNPSPVGGHFTIGEGSGIDRIATRVRVDDDTTIHAVAELSDGRAYAVGCYVKAAGGCSAPALRQTADAIPLGTLRFREFPAATSGPREAQVMVRHPNYSGMQMDQLTRLYIPADFLQTLRIWQGDELLLTIEGGISISENPAFRFSFRPDAATLFRIDGTDSAGRHFSGAFPAEPAGT